MLGASVMPSPRDVPSLSLTRDDGRHRKPSRSTRRMSPRRSHLDVCVGRVETMMSSKSPSRIASRTAANGSGLRAGCPTGLRAARLRSSTAVSRDQSAVSRTSGISSVNSVAALSRDEPVPPGAAVSMRSCSPRPGPSSRPAGLHLRRTAYGHRRRPRRSGRGARRGAGRSACACGNVFDSTVEVELRVRVVEAGEENVPASEPCGMTTRRCGWSHKPSP